MMQFNDARVQQCLNIDVLMDNGRVCIITHYKTGSLDPRTGLHCTGVVCPLRNKTYTI